MDKKLPVSVARDAVGIPQSSIDENGLAFCWSKDDKKWLKIWPIDARERIAAGELSLESPDDAGKGETAPPPAADLEAAFGAMPKATLRGYCMENNVDHSGADTKVSLVTRLVDAGVIPK